MKTPDPNHSIEYDQPNSFDEDRSDDVPVSDELDPLGTLLAEEELPESDNERLYTDEFIRANESASRSLFLGFLGIALLGTSLFAWFILSQSPTDETDDVPSAPVTVPSSPPETIPDLRLDSTSPESATPPTTEGQPNSGTETQQPPLVFPVNPTEPGTTSPAESLPPGSENSPNTSSPPESQDSITSPLPEGTVPPPPPVTP